MNQNKIPSSLIPCRMRSRTMKLVPIQTCFQSMCLFHSVPMFPAISPREIHRRQGLFHVFTVWDSENFGRLFRTALNNVERRVFKFGNSGALQSKEALFCREKGRDGYASRSCPEVLHFCLQ